MDGEEDTQATEEDVKVITLEETPTGGEAEGGEEEAITANAETEGQEQEGGTVGGDDATPTDTEEQPTGGENQSPAEEPVADEAQPAAEEPVTTAADDPVSPETDAGAAVVEDSEAVEGEGGEATPSEPSPGESAATGEEGAPAEEPAEPVEGEPTPEDGTEPEEVASEAANASDEIEVEESAKGEETGEVVDEGAEETPESPQEEEAPPEVEETAEEKEEEAPAVPKEEPAEEPEEPVPAVEEEQKKITKPKGATFDKNDVEGQDFGELIQGEKIGKDQTGKCVEVISKKGKKTFPYRAVDTPDEKIRQEIRQAAPPHEYFGLIFSKDSKRPPAYYHNYFLPCQKQPRPQQHVKVIGKIIPGQMGKESVVSSTTLPLSTIKLRWMLHRRNTVYKVSDLYAYLTSRFGDIETIHQISSNSAIVVFSELVSAYAAIKEPSLGYPWDPLIADWWEPRLNNYAYLRKYLSIEETPTHDLKLFGSLLNIQDKSSADKLAVAGQSRMYKF